VVQVRFGFTKIKRFIRVYGSGSGSVRHPDIFTKIASSRARIRQN